MDTQKQQPISDDQELAKVLAGINEEAQGMAVPAADSATATSTVVPPTTANDDVTSLDALEETPLPSALTSSSDTTLPTPDTDTSAATPTIEPVSAPSSVSDTTASEPTGELATIKDQVIDELRPLVDKLNVPAEEKFDTLLLLLRSTDDKSLIGPAHTAAKQITDESRRAQAYLDIIKEIDYLSAPHNN